MLGVKRYYADLGVGVGPAFEVGEVKEGDKSKPSSAVTIKKKSKPYVFGNKYTFPASDVSPETKHRFQHPMGVRTVRSYRADFDDCEYHETVGYVISITANTSYLDGGGICR